MTDIKPSEYPCPNCKTLTAWTNNPFKPFCSERCRLLDLGAWANEKYKISNTQDDVFSSDINLD